MLIIEDDDLSILVMRKIFRDEFEIYICDSAEEFYKEYSNINLKGTKNGLELIKEIKKLPSFSSTRILCFTAHVQALMLTKAMESGADYFMTKPTSNKVLFETVNFLIESNSPKNKPVI